MKHAPTSTDWRGMSGGPGHIAGERFDKDRYRRPVRGLFACQLASVCFTQDCIYGFGVGVTGVMALRELDLARATPPVSQS